MYFNKSILSVLLLLLIVHSKVQSQILTELDKQTIKFEAEQFLQEYQLLLNNIISPALSRYEVKTLIENSYIESPNQIFLDANVILEDDVNPVNTNKNEQNIKDVTIDKYLNDLDIFYEKSITPTIEFSEVASSEVKQKEYIYLEVYFKSWFKGKHNTVKATYQSTERVATIIATKSGEYDKWEMAIASIVFYTPEKHTFFNKVADTIPLENENIALTDTIIEPTNSNASESYFDNNANSSLSKTPLKLAIGTGTLALLAGTYFQARANSNFNEFEENKTTLTESERQEFEDKDRQLNTLTYISGIAAGGSVIFYYFYKKAYKKSLAQKSLTVQFYQPIRNSLGLSLIKKF